MLTYTYTHDTSINSKANLSISGAAELAAAHRGRRHAPRAEVGGAPS